MSENQAIRVCHISTVHQPYDPRIFVRECGCLSAAGYDVHLVIPANQSGLKDGVHVHSIPRFSSRLARMLVAPWIALRSALKTQSQIYHYHDPELIWMGFLLRWMLGKRVVFDIHESIYRQLQSKDYLPGILGHIVGSSFSVIERVLTTGQQKIVANAASVKEHPEAVLVQNFPREFHLEPAQPRFTASAIPSLVYVGTITEIRGVMEYLRLAKRLKDANRPFKMALIGRIGTEALENRMRRQLEDDGLIDEVSVMGGQEWKIAMQYVADATIGLCLLHPVPNYTTCLATKIIEYMMLGTPVLASAFDVWRPFVEGEEVGHMADPLDDDQIFQTCIDMLDNPDELKAMSARGPLAVAAKYTWEQEFEKLKSCYERLLG